MAAKGVKRGRTDSVPAERETRSSSHTHVPSSPDLSITGKGASIVTIMIVRLLDLFCNILFVRAAMENPVRGIISAANSPLKPEPVESETIVTAPPSEKYIEAGSLEVTPPVLSASEEAPKSGTEAGGSIAEPNEGPSSTISPIKPEAKNDTALEGKSDVASCVSDKATVRETMVVVEPPAEAPSLTDNTVQSTETPVNRSTFSGASEIRANASPTLSGGKAPLPSLSADSLTAAAANSSGLKASLPSDRRGGQSKSSAPAAPSSVAMRSGAVPSVAPAITKPSSSAGAGSSNGIFGRRRENLTTKSTPGNKDFVINAPGLAIPRLKCHWDSVLEEVQWMSVDFRQERRWKLAASKSCAYSCLDDLIRKKFNTEHVKRRRTFESISPKSLKHHSAGIETDCVELSVSNTDQSSSENNKYLARSIAEKLTKGWYGRMYGTNILTEGQSSKLPVETGGYVDHPSVVAEVGKADFFRNVRTVLTKLCDEYDGIPKIADGHQDDIKNNLKDKLFAPVHSRDVLSRCQRLHKLGLGTIIQAPYSDCGVDIGLLVVKLWESELKGRGVDNRVRNIAVFVPRRHIIRWNNDMLIFNSFIREEGSINEATCHLHNEFEGLKKYFSFDGLSDQVRVSVLPAELLYDKNYVINGPGRTGDTIESPPIFWDAILLDTRHSADLFRMNLEKKSEMGGNTPNAADLVQCFNRAFERNGRSPCVDCRRCALMPPHCEIENDFSDGSYGAVKSTSSSDASSTEKFIFYSLEHNMNSNDKESFGPENQWLDLLQPEGQFLSLESSIAYNSTSDDISVRSRSTNRFKSKRIGSGDTTVSPVRETTTSTDCPFDKQDDTLCMWVVQHFCSMTANSCSSSPCDEFVDNIVNVRLVDLNDFQRWKYYAIVRDFSTLDGGSGDSFSGANVSSFAEALMLLQNVCFHHDMVLRADVPCLEYEMKTQISKDIPLERGQDYAGTKAPSINSPEKNDKSASDDVDMKSSSFLESNPEKETFINSGAMNSPKPSAASIINSSGNLESNVAGSRIFKFFPKTPHFGGDAIGAAPCNNGGKLNALRDMLVEAQSNRKARVAVVVESIAESHCVCKFLMSTFRGVVPYVAVESSPILGTGSLSTDHSQNRDIGAGHREYTGRSRMNELVFGNLMTIEDTIYRFNAASRAESLSILVISGTIIERLAKNCLQWGLDATPSFFPAFVDHTIVMSWNWAYGLIPSSLYSVVRSPMTIVGCKDSLEESLIRRADVNYDSVGQSGNYRCATLASLKGKSALAAFFGENTYNSILKHKPEDEKPQLFSNLLQKTLLSHVKIGSESTALSADINNDNGCVSIPGGMSTEKVENTMLWTELLSSKIVSARTVLSFFQTLAFRRMISTPFHFRDCSADQYGGSTVQSMLFFSSWIACLQTKEVKFDDALIGAHRSGTQIKKGSESSQKKSGNFASLSGSGLSGDNSNGKTQCKELTHWWDYFLNHIEDRECCLVPRSSDHDILPDQNLLAGSMSSTFGQKFKSYLSSAHNHYVRAVSKSEHSLYSQYEDNAVVSAAVLRVCMNATFRLATCLKPPWALDFCVTFGSFFLDVVHFGHSSDERIAMGLAMYMDSVNTSNMIWSYYGSSGGGAKALKAPNFGRGRMSSTVSQKTSLAGRTQLLEPLLQMNKVAATYPLGLDNSSNKLHQMRQCNEVMMRNGLGVGGCVGTIEKNWPLCLPDSAIPCDSPSMFSLFCNVPVSNSAYLGTSSAAATAHSINALHSSSSVVAVDIFQHMRNTLLSRGLPTDSHFFSHPLQSSAGILLSQFESMQNPTLVEDSFYSNPEFQKKPDGYPSKANRNIDDVYDVSDVLSSVSWARNDSLSNVLCLAINQGIPAKISHGSNINKYDTADSKNSSGVGVEDRKDSRHKSAAVKSESSRKKNASSSISSALSGTTQHSAEYVSPENSTSLLSSNGNNAPGADNSLSHPFGVPIGLDPFARLVATASRRSVPGIKAVERPYAEKPLLRQKKSVVAVKGKSLYMIMITFCYFLYV